jgi:hypothetical protein
MRPVVRSISSVVADQWVPLDIYETGGLLSINLNFSGGTATAQVDYTFDNPFTVASPQVVGQLIASGSVNAHYPTGTPVPPPAAVRLNVTAFTSGPVVMTVIQQGAR